MSKELKNFAALINAIAITADSFSRTECKRTRQALALAIDTMAEEAHEIAFDQCDLNIDCCFLGRTNGDPARTWSALAHASFCIQSVSKRARRTLASTTGSQAEALIRDAHSVNNWIKANLNV